MDPTDTIDRPALPADDAEAALAGVWAALSGPPALPGLVHRPGRTDALPAAYDVGTLAVVAVAAATLAAAELLAARAGGPVPAVTVDAVHAAAAFRAEALYSPSWTPPPTWDPLAGDYRGADGWVRLHTNYAHHRDAALAVLTAGRPVERDVLAGVVAQWPVESLEDAVVAAGGCAAALRSGAEWAAHPQGRAVAGEPLVGVEAGAPAGEPAWAATAPGGRPFAGVRVLDLTRVIAGPVGSGFLAAWGAEVLRVDPVGFDEVPALVPLTTAGKRRCRLDLRDADGRRRFDELVVGADVVVSGLRPGALDGLGYATDRLRELNPGLVVVRHDAYGWTGPWAGRRGFDSLVQMSTGIAAPSTATGARPQPLPAQALDHATGYLVAAAAGRALTGRLGGRAGTASLSLARTAGLLAGLGGGRRERPGRALTGAEIEATLEPVATAWGPARRVRWPGVIDGAAPATDRPPGPLGSDPACWPTAPGRGGD